MVTIFSYKEIESFNQWRFLRLGQCNFWGSSRNCFGPPLFLLHVNDLDSVVKKFTIKLFAADDDVLLYSPANTEQECCTLQSDLTAIFNWTNCWLLKLNITKCEALAITNKWKPISFTYFINGQSLSWNDPVKYLGLLVDHKLSWSKHCRHTVKKATRSLNCLCFSMYIWM